MKRNRNECASGAMGPAGVCIPTCCSSGAGAVPPGGSAPLSGRAGSAARGHQGAPQAAFWGGGSGRARERPAVPAPGTGGWRDGWCGRRARCPLGGSPAAAHSGFPLSQVRCAQRGSAGAVPVLGPDPEPALTRDPMTHCITSKLLRKKSLSWKSAQLRMQGKNGFYVSTTQGLR